MSSSSFEGKVHNFATKLSAFEFTPTNAPNTIIFVGGLGDGLLTVPYIPEVVSKLPANWSFCNPILTSSYNGWGTGSLKRDAEEIGQLVKYLRVNCHKKRIVVMGHSTGTQDVIQYLAKYLPSLTADAELFNIDGAILQAPASDREMFLRYVPPAKLEALISAVKTIVKENNGDENVLLPGKFSKLMFGTPTTAYRYLSLAVPYGDDDFFSNDLLDLPDDHPSSPAQTFGKVKIPLLLVPSELDECVPETIDQG